MKMPVLGFRFGKFTYITDANNITAEEQDKVRGSGVLVLNALRKEKHVSHFTLEEAVATAQQLGCGQTYLTHISHQMGRHADVSAQLPRGIALAYDQLEVHLP
jgi:phosphoribosyl 1,2-cyclic phosphate phosphodiesterase